MQMIFLLNQLLTSHSKRYLLDIITAIKLLITLPILAHRSVNHFPKQPTSGEDVMITTKVNDAHGVQNVVLEYQVVTPGAYIRLTDAAYQTSWTSVTMTDDGMGADETAGDVVYLCRYVCPPSRIEVEGDRVTKGIRIAVREGHALRAT